jgi:hypothetical protein
MISIVFYNKGWPKEFSLSFYSCVVAMVRQVG